MGSMSGIANLGLLFSTRTTPEVRSSSDIEGESVLSSASTKTSSAETAHSNQRVRAADRAVEAAERGVRFTDTTDPTDPTAPIDLDEPHEPDEPGHHGFLDGLFANNRPKSEARVSFHASVAVGDETFASTPPTLGRLSRRSLAEMDSLHKTHTPPSSSDYSNHLFGIKDVVSAKLTNTPLPPNQTLCSTKGRPCVGSLPHCNKRVPSLPPPGTVQSNRESHARDSRDSDASDMRSLLGSNLACGHNRRSSTFAAVNFTGFEGAFGAREDDEQATWREQKAIYANFQRQADKEASEETPTCLQA